jgi:hypothetical protein
MGAQMQITLQQIVNASASPVQLPRISYSGFPYGEDGTLTTPVAVSGQVIGIPSPDTYKLGFFSKGDQPTDQWYGGYEWMATLDAEGNYSVNINTMASLYSAVLMTSTFWQSFYSANFPANGNGSLQSLPTPVTNPGDVLLATDYPAGYDRTLIVSHLSPPLKPGTTSPDGYKSVFFITGEQGFMVGSQDPTTSPLTTFRCAQQAAGYQGVSIQAANEKEEPTGGVLYIAPFGLPYQDIQKKYDIYLLIAGSSVPNPTSDSQVQAAGVLLGNTDQHIGNTAILSLTMGLTILPSNFEIRLLSYNFDNAVMQALQESLEILAKGLVRVFFAVLTME